MSAAWRANAIRNSRRTLAAWPVQNRGRYSGRHRETLYLLIREFTKANQLQFLPRLVASSSRRKRASIHPPEQRIRFAQQERCRRWIRTARVRSWPTSGEPLNLMASLAVNPEVLRPREKSRAWLLACRGCRSNTWRADCWRSCRSCLAGRTGTTRT